jgi:hypothetical protein
VGVSGRSRSGRIWSLEGIEDEALALSYELVALPKTSFVGLERDENWASSKRASLERSSHRPRTVSKLFPIRCEGVHRRGVTETTDDPVVLVRRFTLDCELLRDRELPAPREDVRSNKRVWYAKGAEVPDREPLDELEGTELERSIRI